MKTLRQTKIPGWFEYYREYCPICGHTGGCMINEDGDTVVCIRTESDRIFSQKFVSYLHFLDEKKAQPVTNKWQGGKQRQKLDAQILNLLYRTLLLNRLNLSQGHLQHLTAPNRGLTLEQIQVRGYKSLDWGSIKALTFPKNDIGGLPGIYKDENGQWKLHAMEGILIPYRNHFNEIIGFQIRVDNPRNTVSIEKSNFPSLNARVKNDDKTVQVLVDGEIIQETEMQVGQELPIHHDGQVGSVKLKKGLRYFWLSSANKNEGCGAGDPTPYHVAVPTNRLTVIENTETDMRSSLRAKSVWITEGALKADIASEHIHRAFTSEQISLLGDTFIGIPGVNTWGNIMPVLKEMGVEQVNVAFDMDVFSNEDVKRNLLGFVEALKAEKFTINYVVWNSKDSKGIDDLFIKRMKPQIRKINY
ncbi:DUF3854 domain-containing protein [Butyricicoccus sp. 1XD8-22]|nr:DUF3854 domain-containing protein [Butyricicoccus sp. 1XD8-22]